MNLETLLNKNQLDAVSYIDGPSLVIAGAGSGKTRVLIFKIIYLMQHGYEPWSILALTFTNKAAREMKERIASYLGEDFTRNLWMGTFHSVFSKILRFEAHVIGYDPNFTIYDQTDSRSLVRSIIKDMRLDDKLYKPASVAERISWAKSRLITAQTYSQNGEMLQNDRRLSMPSIVEIYRIYSERCRLANAMDFDDLLVNTYKLLDEYPQICEKYAKRFGYILVDEFQDTNYVQSAILWKLAEVNRRICVVGDDAQSIYSFRGANIENILGFAKRYDDAKIFKLEQNYRSTQMIVEAANSLIEKNSQQIRKKVFSNEGFGEPLSVLAAYSDIEEGELVANKIQNLHRSEALDYDKFAILYRTNAQSRIFEEAFRKRSMPYRIYGGLSFYQRKEIKDVIAYFRLACNLVDEEALRRVINFPARGIGDTTVMKLSVMANESARSMWRVLETPLEYNVQVNKGTLAKLENFSSMIKNFSLYVKDCDAYEAAMRIVRESGIIAELYRDNSTEGKSRQENLEELMSAVQDFVSTRREEGYENNRMSDYLSEVSLLSDQNSDDDDTLQRITMMTVHSAKGLEFNVVFIVGMEENLFPNAMAQNSQRELEEERRLLYVAITRAREKCLLSFAKSRYRYGSFEFCEPSRFFKDIDSKYIDMACGKEPYQKSVYGSTQHKAYERSPSTNPLSHRNAVSPTISTIKPNLQRVDVAMNRNASASNALQSTLSTGQVIQHDRFGIGDVVSVEGAGENAKATISFRNVGVKQLLLKFARFKVLE